jgi:hypothetical protein
VASPEVGFLDHPMNQRSIINRRSRRTSSRPQRPVVVAVISVLVVQASIYEVVAVVAVRHGLVLAIWAVLMAGVVTARGIGVFIRIRVANRDDVLFDSVATNVVQMPVL